MGVAEVPPSARGPAPIPPQGPGQQQGPPPPPDYWKALGHAEKVKLLNQKLMELDVSFRMRLEQLGVAGEQIAQQAAQMSMQDRQNKLLAIEEMAEWGDYRAPQTADRFLREVQELEKGAGTDLIGLVSRVRTGIGQRAEYGKQTFKDEETIRAYARDLRERETEKGFTEDVVSGAVKGAVLGHYGPANERVMEGVSDTVERAVQTRRERWGQPQSFIGEEKDHPKGFDSDEEYRARLIRVADEEIRANGGIPEEGTGRWLGREAAHFASMLIPASLAGKIVGGVAGGTARAAGAGVKTVATVGKLAGTAGAGLAFATAAALQGAPPSVKAQLDRGKVDENGEPTGELYSEEERDQIESAATKLSAVTAAVLAPVLHMAPVVGRYMTGGVGGSSTSGALQWMRTSVGFPIAGEAGQGLSEMALHGVEEWLGSEDSKKTWREMSKLAPHAPGAAEQVIRAGYAFSTGGSTEELGQQLVKAVETYVEQFAPAALAFGATQVLTKMGAGQLITPGMRRAAVKDVDRILDPTEADAAQRAGMLHGKEPVDTEAATRAEAEAVVGKEALEKDTAREIAAERAKTAVEAELEAPEKTRGPTRFEEEADAVTAEVEAKRTELESMAEDTAARRALESEVEALEEHVLRVRSLAEVAEAEPARELEVPIRPGRPAARTPEEAARAPAPEAEHRAVTESEPSARPKEPRAEVKPEDPRRTADAETARKDSDAALAEAERLYEQSQATRSPGKRNLLEARADALAGYSASLRRAETAAREGRQVSWPRRPSAEDVSSRAAKLRDTQKARAAKQPAAIKRAAERARRKALSVEAYSKRQQERFARDMDTLGLATAARLHVQPGDQVRIGGEVFHVERVSGNRIGLRSESGARSRRKFDTLERNGGLELVRSNLGRRQMVDRAIARNDMEAAVSGLDVGDVVGTSAGQATVMGRSGDGVRVRLPDGTFHTLTSNTGPRLRGRVQPRAATPETTEQRTVSVLAESTGARTKEGREAVETVLEAAKDADAEAVKPTQQTEPTPMEGTGKVEPPAKPTPTVKDPKPKGAPAPEDPQAVGVAAVKTVEALRRNGVLKDLVTGELDAALEKAATKARGEAKDFATWLQGQAWFRDAMGQKRANKRELVADAVWRWMMKKHGIQMPTSSLEGFSETMLRELDAILKVKDPAARLQRMLDWQKLNEAALSGPQAVAMRFSPAGVRFLGRYELAKRAMFNGPSAAFSGLPIPYILQAVYPLLNLSSYATSWAGMSLTPNSVLKYVSDAVKHLDADPALDAHGLRSKMFLSSFEGPWWAGRVASDAVITVSRIADRVSRLHRAVLGPRGLLRRAGITQGSKASADLFEALDQGPNSLAWRSLTPEHRYVAEKLRKFHKTFARLIARHQPFMLRTTTEIELLGVKHQRAQAAADRAFAEEQAYTGPDPKVAKRLQDRVISTAKRAQKLQDWITDVTQKQREFMDEWGIDDYVRYVRVAQQMGSSDYHPNGDAAFHKLRRPARTSIEKKRQQEEDAELDAKYPLIRDAVVAMSDYLPQAIGAIEKQAFFRRNGEFLYGKPRLSTVADLMSPNSEAWFADSVRDDASTRSFRGRGFFYHDPQTGTVTRAPLPPAGQGGIPPSRNALGHRLVVGFVDHAAGRRPERPAYSLSTDRLEHLGAEQLQRAIEGGAVRLESPFKALEYVVHEGGWFTRASRERQAGMTGFLEEFAYGIRAQETKMFAAKSYAKNAWLAHIERGVRRGFQALSSPIIGMWNYKTALTALAGGTFHNQNLLSPGMLAESGVEAMRFLGRRARGRAGVGDLDVLTGTAENPDLRLQRDVEGMRTKPSDLVGLTPEQLKRRETWDEAFEDFLGSGIMQGKIADAHDSSMKVRELKAGEVAPWWKKIPRGVGHVMNRIDHAGYALLSATEAMVRSQGWLGVYMSARDGGAPRMEARKLAELSMLMQHGVFNHVAGSAFFKSWVGPGLGGVMSWASHWFGQFTRAPARYKLHYMAQSVTAWYLLKAMGGGDMTNVFGGSMYDVVAINKLAERFGIGVVSPLAHEVPVAGDLLGSIADTGFVPFPFPSGDSPLLSLLDGAFEAATLLLDGRVDDSARVFRDTALRSMTPRVAEEINTFLMSAKAEKAPGFENEPDVWRAVPIVSKLFGLKSESIPVEAHGLVGLMLSALPGLEPWRAEQIVDMRKNRIEQDKATGQANQRRDEARSILRRMEELRQAPDALGAREESEELRTKFAELSRASAQEGQFLHTPSEIKQLSKDAKGETLPSPLRQVARAPNKEVAARQMANVFEAINEGRYKFASSDILELLRQVTGEQGFDGWAADPKITGETKKRLSAAVKTWMASRRSTSATPTRR